MAISEINTYLQDSEISTIEVNDGVGILFSTGAEINNSSKEGVLSLNYNTPLMLTSLSDAVSIGITEAYDTTNKVGLYFNISEFYAKAGSSSILWVCIYNKTTYATPDLFLKSENYLQALRDTVASNFDNRPRLVGILQGTDTTAPSSGGLSTVTINAISAFNVAQNNSFQESIRTVGILDSGKIGAVNTLPDGATYNAGNVALVITTTTPGKTASVGDVMGIASSIGLAESIGSGVLGSIHPQGYFIDSANTPVRSTSKTTFELLGKNQYVFLRYRAQAGVVYNDGATLNSPTMALSRIEYVRVGNSICDLVEKFFVTKINTPVPVESNGDISSAWKNSQLAALDSQYLQPRINRGDASQINVDIQAVNNNFVQTRTIKVTVQVLPTPNLENVDIYVMFVQSL